MIHASDIRALFADGSRFARGATCACMCPSRRADRVRLC